MVSGLNQEMSGEVEVDAGTWRGVVQDRRR